MVPPCDCRGAAIRIGRRQRISIGLRGWAGVTSGCWGPAAGIVQRRNLSQIRTLRSSRLRLPTRWCGDEPDREYRAGENGERAHPYQAAVSCVRGMRAYRTGDTYHDQNGAVDTFLLVHSLCAASATRVPTNTASSENPRARGASQDVATRRKHLLERSCGVAQLR